MSVENSKPSRSSNNDLSDLQAEYAKKRRTYTREQEQELEELKEHYNTRKAEVRSQGEAAINHIRNKQGDSVRSATEARQQAAQRSEAQIGAIESDYRKKVQATQQQRQIQLDAARTTSKEKIAEIETNQQNKIQKIRNDSNQEVTEIKTRYNKEVRDTQDFTGKRIHDIKENNDRAVKNELERGRQVQGKLQENLKKDFDTVNTQGNERIQDRKLIQEQQLKRQEEEFDKSFTKKKNQWESTERLTNEQYQKRLGMTKEAYEKQLKDQNGRFQSMYQKNESANREALRIQDHNMLKEQIELKKKFFRESEKYAGKEDDPFYKLQDRGNRLRESPDFYVVDAYVPVHEKDSIQVTIKDDKAMIAGKRAFKEEIDEEGRRLSTNSYQTFREEFAFDKPVITEGMTRERTGDYVTFFIPKLNSFDTARKLNKKA